MKSSENTWQRSRRNVCRVDPSGHEGSDQLTAGGRGRDALKEAHLQGDQDSPHFVIWSRSRTCVQLGISLFIAQSQDILTWTLSHQALIHNWGLILGQQIPCTGPTTSVPVCTAGLLWCTPVHYYRTAKRRYYDNQSMRPGSGCQILISSRI